jgi:hypothetical protein
MKLLNGCQKKYIANKTMTNTEKSIVNKSISNQNPIVEVSINNQKLEKKSINPQLAMLQLTNYCSCRKSFEKKINYNKIYM